MRVLVTLGGCGRRILILYIAIARYHLLLSNLGECGLQVLAEDFLLMPLLV